MKLLISDFNLSLYFFPNSHLNLYFLLSNSLLYFSSLQLVGQLSLSFLQIKQHCLLHTKQYTLHSTHHTLHTTVYILHTTHTHTTHCKTLYTVHSLQTTHYTLHTAYLYCIVHTVNCILHTAYFILHTLYYIMHTTMMQMCKCIQIHFGKVWGWSKQIKLHHGPLYDWRNKNVYKKVQITFKGKFAITNKFCLLKKILKLPNDSASTHFDQADFLSSAKCTLYTTLLGAYCILHTCVSSRHSRKCVTLRKLMTELIFFF